VKKWTALESQAMKRYCFGNATSYQRMKYVNICWVLSAAVYY